MCRDTKCQFKTQEGIDVTLQPPIEVVKFLLEHTLKRLMFKVVAYIEKTIEVLCYKNLIISAFVRRLIDFCM